MSKPTDPDPSTPGSRAPKSGRKYIDPTKYQMDTVPAELVAKIAKMKIESLPEEALRPPPLFDKRPIIGKLRRLGVWVSRRRLWLLIGCFVGLCVVVTMSMMRGGAKVDEQSEGVRTVERSAEPSLVDPARNEPSPAVSASPVGSSIAPKTPNVNAPKTSSVEKLPTPPKSGASTSQTELPSRTNTPKRAVNIPTKTTADPSNGADIMDTPFARKKPRSATR